MKLDSALYSHCNTSLTFVVQHRTMQKATLLSLVTLLITIGASAQRNYTTLQGEYIFSLSSYSGTTDLGGPRLRFTRFPNAEVVYNIDGKGLVGFYFGLATRNVGINWKDSVKHKRRAQSIGAPLVLKIGDIENNNFFFMGAEAEYFFHLKKKDWGLDGKEKTGEWLSDEINPFQPSVMAGFCAKRVMIKAKYYLNDFFNASYQDASGANIYAPYPSNIFYLSLTFRTELGGNKNEDDEKDDDGDEGLDIGSVRTNLLYRDL